MLKNSNFFRLKFNIETAVGYSDTSHLFFIPSRLIPWEKKIFHALGANFLYEEINRMKANTEK